MKTIFTILALAFTMVMQTAVSYASSGDVNEKATIEMSGLFDALEVGEITFQPVIADASPGITVTKEMEMFAPAFVEAKNAAAIESTNKRCYWCSTAAQAKAYLEGQGYSGVSLISSYCDSSTPGETWNNYLFNTQAIYDTMVYVKCGNPVTYQHEDL